LQMVHSLEIIQSKDIEIHGGKAINLARLTQLGFLVPKGVSISSAAFVQMVKSNQDLINLLRKVDESDDFEDILEISASLQIEVGNYGMPENLESEISKSIKHLAEMSGNKELGFAVRSSATIEDRSDISFAGQAESYLCVKNQSDIIESVLKVWQSMFSERAIIYLKTKGISMSRVKMAVIVQEMIPANISGVMFTANVVNNNTEEVLINATWGLGDSLVSGKIVPDTYILTKDPLSVIQRDLGGKEFTSIPEMNQSAMLETSKNKQSEFTLDDQTLFKIAKIGMKIEGAMGTPQDIEWCINQDGNLVILQSRPITTLNVPSSHEE
jgi:pyruvate,water dikinase